MAYDQKLASRIRERLVDVKRTTEKQMMGGLTFMVNGKMCVGIFKNELMCRIDPEIQEAALSRTGSRIMDFTGRPMRGYVLVDESGIKSKKDFDYWIDLCLGFNEKAKSSKRKKPLPSKPTRTKRNNS